MSTSKPAPLTGGLGFFVRVDGPDLFDALRPEGACRLVMPCVVELGILLISLPHLAGVIVEGVEVDARLLLVVARAHVPEAACPRYGTVSRRVRSRYSRRLADAAIGGRQVEIRLAVHRFFCPSAGCKRKTFAEQVQGLTTRYARKTQLRWHPASRHPGAPPQW